MRELKTYEVKSVSGGIIPDMPVLPVRNPVNEEQIRRILQQLRFQQGQK